MIVLVEKQVEVCLMYHVQFRERQRLARFTNKTGQTLSQRLVLLFDMGRFSCVFSHNTVLLFWNYRVIGRPKIGETWN